MQPVIKYSLDLASASIAHLRNYSQSLADQFELSTTRFIDLTELQSSLDRSLTLEPFPNLADFHYRFYGTVLSKHMAHNLAKSLVLEFENSYTNYFQLADYKAMCQHREPYTHGTYRIRVNMRRRSSALRSRSVTTMPPPISST